MLGPQTFCSETIRQGGWIYYRRASVYLLNLPLWPPGLVKKWIRARDTLFSCACAICVSSRPALRKNRGQFKKIILRMRLSFAKSWSPNKHVTVISRLTNIFKGSRAACSNSYNCMLPKSYSSYFTFVFFPHSGWEKEAISRRQSWSSPSLMFPL